MTRYNAILSLLNILAYNLYPWRYAVALFYPIRDVGHILYLASTVARVYLSRGVTLTLTPARGVLHYDTKCYSFDILL